MLKIMSELEDGQGPVSSTNLTELRRELARVRVEADREIAQLRQQVAAPKSRELPKDSRRAADQLALEQEINALRRALAEKDRTLDSISQECRRLEDAIEDEHRAVETLSQDLGRKETALASEHKTVADLEQERDELRVRILERRTDAGRGEAQEGGAAAPPSHLPAFLAGVGLGLSIAVAAGVGYLGVNGFIGHGLGSPPAADVPAIAPAGVTGDRAVATEPVPATPDAEPIVLRTVRDRFSDGTAGPLMVALPGGTFAMGSRSMGGERDEQPEHQVTVGSFLIGTNEVTFADYDRFVRAAGRRFPDDFGWGRGRRPVVDVSWEDAQAYAQWLSRQTGQRYRLPSEAEWEYAARGGTKSAYWWGYAPEAARALCFDCGTTWDARSTAPVGSFEPNPFGLYDTAGNALEWTADCYRPSYDRAPTDGSAWNQEPCQARVARGGAFNKPAKSMRSPARTQFAPDTRINMLGFRLARDD